MAAPLMDPCAGIFVSVPAFWQQRPFSVSLQLCPYCNRCKLLYHIKSTMIPVRGGKPLGPAGWTDPKVRFEAAGLAQSSPLALPFLLWYNILYYCA